MDALNAVLAQDGQLIAGQAIGIHLYYYSIVEKQKIQFIANRF